MFPIELLFFVRPTVIFCFIATSELLHIGNDLDKDYKGAISAGAQALLFDPSNKHPKIPDQEKLVNIYDLERVLL